MAAAAGAAELTGPAWEAAWEAVGEIVWEAAERPAGGTDEADGDAAGAALVMAGP